MSRNQQLQLPGLPINQPSGTYYPTPASSQSPGYNSDSNMNPPYLPILDTFYRYLPPDSDCGVSMCNPNIHRDPFPAPRGVQYAPPPPGVQYAPARYGTPGLTMYNPTQSGSVHRASGGPSISQKPKPSVSLPNTATVTTMAARQKRVQSPESKGEIRFKRVKVTHSDEAASRRLRIGSLDARVRSDEIQGLFRDYAMYVETMFWQYQPLRDALSSIH